MAQRSMHPPTCPHNQQGRCWTSSKISLLCGARSGLACSLALLHGWADWKTFSGPVFPVDSLTSLSKWRSLLSTLLAPIRRSAVIYPRPRSAGIFAAYFREC